MVTQVDFAPQSNRTTEISTPAGTMAITFRPVTPDERISDSSWTYALLTSDPVERPPLIKQRFLGRLAPIADWRDLRDVQGNSIPFNASRLRELMTLSPAWLECIATAVNAFWNDEPAPAPASEQAA